VHPISAGCRGLLRYRYVSHPAPVDLSASSAEHCTHATSSVRAVEEAEGVLSVSVGMASHSIVALPRLQAAMCQQQHGACQVQEAVAVAPMGHRKFSFFLWHIMMRSHGVDAMA
jgi:hypothetical protein